MNKTFDIIIVGSGVGGLSTLLYLTKSDLFKAGHLSICLIAKGDIHQTNTNWAQGGIAAVQNIHDNFEKHIQDTLVAGAYCNDTKIVEKVIKAAPALIEDLVAWGTSFDVDEKNNYYLAKEGGHAEARILHHADQTGMAIQNALVNTIQNFQHITVIENTTVINAVNLKEGGFGLNILYNQNKGVDSLFCNQLILATGGLGMLFEKTTNQSISTGDGVMIAHQLGAKLENLSYIQFHPTGLFEEGNISFLISEALRGAGGILRNEHGQAFMHKYDERLELAPRDIVSRSIFNEIGQQKKAHVFLDATKINEHILNTHFPAISAQCKERLGIDISKEFIPVVPVQHYACGGVKVNEFGETNIKGLYAIGEVACTGLHGANRLASNSLLEALAFAQFSSIDIVSRWEEKQIIKTSLEIPQLYKIDRLEVQKIISNYAGIIKSNMGLKSAMESLLQIKNKALPLLNLSVNDIENCNLLTLAILLVQDAQQKKENKGVFYNLDLM